MNLFTPQTPPYSAEEWQSAPLQERARLCTESWAIQGYGTPISAYLFYALKAFFYLWGWTFWCSVSPELGGWQTLGDWWLHPLAFEKAILWSMLFEVLGLGWKWATHRSLCAPNWWISLFHEARNPEGTLVC